jgi:hypothetical protein
MHSANGSRQIVDAEQRRDAADRNGPAIRDPLNLARTRGANVWWKMMKPSGETEASNAGEQLVEG